MILLPFWKSSDKQKIQSIAGKKMGYAHTRL